MSLELFHNNNNCFPLSVSDDVKNDKTNQQEFVITKVSIVSTHMFMFACKSSVFGKYGFDVIIRRAICQ